MITATFLTLIVLAFATSQAVRLLRNVFATRPRVQTVEAR